MLLYFPLPEGDYEILFLHTGVVRPRAVEAVLLIPVWEWWNSLNIFVSAVICNYIKVKHLYCGKSWKLPKVWRKGPSSSITTILVWLISSFRFCVLDIETLDSICETVFEFSMDPGLCSFILRRERSGARTWRTPVMVPRLCLDRALGSVTITLQKY